MRRSREQALNAAARAKRTGAALTWLGGEVLPGLRLLPDPGQPDAHAVASRYLAALDDYLTAAARRCRYGRPHRLGACSPPFCGRQARVWS